VDKKYTYEELKAKHRELREVEKWDRDFGTRIHRALSWLDRSEREKDDLDAKFIFLWISFNAAYAQELDTGGIYHDKKKNTEQTKYGQFVNKLIECDKNKNIYNILWIKFSGPIRLLIDNQFIFRPFWDFQRGKSYQDLKWEDDFKKEKDIAHKHLSQQNVSKLLIILLDRLYMLRIQLMHGGATWNSGVNREQVRDGAEILSFLMPIIIDTMMGNYGSDWGETCFPVIE